MHGCLHNGNPARCSRWPCWVKTVFFPNANTRVVWICAESAEVLMLGWAYKTKIGSLKFEFQIKSYKSNLTIKKDHEIIRFMMINSLCCLNIRGRGNHGLVSLSTSFKCRKYSTFAYCTPTINSINIY